MEDRGCPTKNAKNLYATHFNSTRNQQARKLVTNMEYISLKKKILQSQKKSQYGRDLVFFFSNVDLRILKLILKSWYVKLKYIA